MNTKFGVDNKLKTSSQILESTQLSPQVEVVGRVQHIADGVAKVSGLPDVGLNELLIFEDGQSGLVLTLDSDSISVVIFDNPDSISAGSKVRATGDELNVPVGENLLGRVVDSLGNPLDAGEVIHADVHHPVEKSAPAIIDRALVSEPLPTGILTIDSLFALGRGQRELIIGDRATGKTSIAVDAIINQKNSDIICVYVAIGQRTTAVERVIDSIKMHGAFERCVIVVAGPGSSTGLQWIAPFSGMTIAEYFRDQGQHALIVLDDLSKHAATHRELALLTNEPPGREAYPGDIFYLHARLLERAAQLSSELGGGSLTALPIAETDAGNLSAYIPTNLISITDGQVVLDSRLFAANQRPAIDVGLSVSRVGGKAQSPSLKKVSGRMRLDYAQFLEFETFTRFGGVTDERVKTKVVRGERIRALLSQPRFATLRTVDIIALLSALVDGTLDQLAINDIHKLRLQIASNLDQSAFDIVSAVEQRKTLEPVELKRLIEVVEQLVVSFNNNLSEVPDE